jgi:hypothetical protein
MRQMEMGRMSSKGVARDTRMETDWGNETLLDFRVGGA